MGKHTVHAVILAGGRGTRFWPRSRVRSPKQLLNITGTLTMLEQTVKRLAPVFPAAHIWTVTNAEQAAAVRRQLPGPASRRVLSEPVGRNTAAAIGLAAVHILRSEAPGAKDALMAVLPADHFVAHPERYRQIVRAALDAAREPGRMVVLGIPPARPETGFGYIERTPVGGRAGRAALRSHGFPVYAVRRFTEKPALADARRYLKSGRHDWNAGMFFWRASTFLDNLKEFLPESYRTLMRLGDFIGTSRYERELRRAYPKLVNISVDYAILEPATRRRGAATVYVIPAEVGWSDIGSWAAVHELLAKNPGANVSAGEFAALDAEGNFLWSPNKFIAAIGVNDLVVVETKDALLICPRDRAQDVGKVVKWLEAKKRSALL
jgi:mannose-1-phosphate guanylyltransferase